MELDTANKANRNWLEGMVAPTDGMLNFPGILRSVDIHYYQINAGNKANKAVMKNKANKPWYLSWQGPGSKWV